MTHSGPRSVRKSKIDISTPDPKPVLTCLWMLLPVVLSLAGMALLPNDRIDYVVKAGITPAQMASEYATNPGVALQHMLTASWAQLSITVYFLNCLFLWILGAPLERRLKGWRFPMYLTCVCISGWMCVYYTAGFNQDKVFIGPSMMLFGLLGGYFSFFPKKPFEPKQWLRPSTEIFKKEDKRKNEERYWVSPWVYISAFAIYQVLMQVGLSYSKDQIVNMTNITFLGQMYTVIFGRMQINPSVFTPIAAMFQIGCGALLAQILPAIAVSLKPKRPGGNLQLEVIQHYRELRTLDMTHEQACEGAAKFAAVPIEIARDWIAKGAAGLKDQNLKQQQQ